MFYCNPYKNGSRVVNTNNSNEGIYIPKESSIKDTLRRLKGRLNYSKGRGLEPTDYDLKLVEELKGAINQGLN